MVRKQDWTGMENEEVDGPGPAKANKLSEGQFNEAIIAPLSELWRKKRAIEIHQTTEKHFLCSSQTFIAAIFSQISIKTFKARSNHE